MKIDHELAVLKTMADELADYLRSETLLWPLGGPSSFPKLTLGMLWLTHQRLLAADADLTPFQRAERDQTVRRLEASLAQWPVAAENKAAHELRMRVNLWAAWVQDSLESSTISADNYLMAATHRTIAALLLQHYPRLTASPEALRLAPLDVLVRARWQVGPFLWPATWQSHFPAEAFWFLYGNLQPLRAR